MDFSVVKQQLLLATSDLAMVSTFHQALNAKYGTDCCRNLNILSALLRKLVVSSSGLVYLQKCCFHRVYLAFIAQSVKFSQLGHHLERLAYKLPGRMLRATIRDVRSCIAHLEKEIDSVWIRLFWTITDVILWNNLVKQKDIFYASILTTSSLHLRKKFVGLFYRAPDDPYCHFARAPPKTRN